MSIQVAQEAVAMSIQAAQEAAAMSIQAVQEAAAREAILIADQREAVGIVMPVWLRTRRATVLR
jgi:hypothetical protein